MLKVAREQGIEEAVRRYRKEVIEHLPKHGRWSDENTRKHIESALRQWNAGSYAGAVTSPVYGDTNLPVGCSWAVRKLAAAGKWDEAIDLLQREEQKQVDAGTRGSVRSRAAIRQLIEHALEREAGGYSGARAPDAVVSSPPFLQAKGGGGINVKGYGDGSDKVGERTYNRKMVGTSPAQIGNLPDPKNDIDAVLSSPPYQHEGPTRSSKKYEQIRKEMGRSLDTPSHKQAMGAGYGDSVGQIGKESGETYLSSMRQVYAQLHLVLKPGGVVCLVTKNPVKKGQIRRLDSDTIRLMESCGFTFLERQRAMLTEELGVQQRLDGGQETIRRERKSFFKRLFERKYPDLRVDHKDILWFRSVEEKEHGDNRAISRVGGGVGACRLHD